VLEGSVRRSGDHVRVTARLIQSKDQTHLWAQDYDRQMTDVLEIQSAITSAIANENQGRPAKVERPEGDQRGSLRDLPSRHPGPGTEN
jgi:adenylate cyclase